MTWRRIRCESGTYCVRGFSQFRHVELRPRPIQLLCRAVTIMSPRDAVVSPQLQLHPMIDPRSLPLLINLSTRNDTCRKRSRPGSVGTWHTSGVSIKWTRLISDVYRKNLIAALDLREGNSVLDVGCGFGANHDAISLRLGSRRRLACVDMRKQLWDQASQRDLKRKNRKTKTSSAAGSSAWCVDWQMRILTLT
jgi:hypothetical protein